MSTYNDQDFEELKELVEENNKILRSLQKKARWATAFTVIRWSVVIAIAIGLFTILQPIIQNLIEAYGLLMENLASINNAKDSISGVIDVPELLKIFGN